MDREFDFLGGLGHLIHWAEQRSRLDAPTLLAVAGGSASGKSTLAKLITEKVEGATLIEMDWYYLDGRPHPTSSYTDHDHPLCIERTLMVYQVSQLLKGNEVQRPVYRYELGRMAETVRVKPSSVIIVDGMHAIHALSGMTEHTVYVDAEDDVRYQRREKRDINPERMGAANLSKEFIHGKWLETVLPRHREFVEPQRKKAKIIVYNNHGLSF